MPRADAEGPPSFKNTGLTAQAMICAAVGLAVSIPMHAGYNYLVSRVNSIVLDMERAATEIVKIVTEPNGNKAA